VLTEIVQFLSQIGDENLKIFIDFNKPLDFDVILPDLKNKMDKLDAILVFDDFHKANEDLRNLFAQIVEKFEKTENVKFIILTRYNIPFYDQQKVLIRDSVAELEIEGLDFESSSKIMNRKQLPKNKYKDIYTLTSGSPLLLEIFDSEQKTRRYIYEEIFSQFTHDERRIMEILATYKIPISYEAFFIDDKVLPGSIDDLIRKLIIKQTPGQMYDSHEFIKDSFYQRLSPHSKREYHKLCAEFYQRSNIPVDYIHTYYHYLRSEQFQQAIDFAIKNIEKIINLGVSERFLTMIEELPEEQVDLPQWVQIIMLKARLSLIIGDWAKSMKYYYNAIEISSELDNNEIKAMAYCKLGLIQEEQNSFDEALENFQKGLKSARQTQNKSVYKDSLIDLKGVNDFKLLGSIHIELGNICIETEKNSKAINYFTKALGYLDKSQARLEMARAYNSLGTVYRHMNKFNEAIEIYNKQLEIAEVIGDITQLSYALSNIAYSYAKLHRINDAKKYIDRTMEISEIRDNENILFCVFKTNGLIYQHKKEWNNAINSFNKSIAIIKKLNVPFWHIITLQELASVYEEKGDTDNAKECYIEIGSLYQSIGKKIPKQLEKRM
jgi:tetratricopeptide (TPR) repeat protein